MSHLPPPSAPPGSLPNLTASMTGIPVASSPVEWSTGLFGCLSDIPNCLITCFCPCITFGQISEIVDRGTSSCAVNGVIYALFILVTGFPCIYSCFYRRRMRHEYNLRGNPCSDCCIHFCCEPVALSQEYRQLKLHGFDMNLGWHANIERQNQGSMRIPPLQTSMRR